MRQPGGSLTEGKLNLLDFINKYTGKFIDFDGSYGKQCVDLTNQWMKEGLGIANPIQTLPIGDAYQAFTNFPNYPATKYFDRIAYKPGVLPTPGDLMVFNHDVPNLTGPGGHISIFVSGNPQLFTSFDQNSPVGSPCNERVHNYYGVLGWLHFKGGDEVIDQEGVDLLYRAVYHIPGPTSGSGYLGHTFKDALKDILSQPMYKDIDSKLGLVAYLKKWFTGN